MHPDPFLLLKPLIRLHNAHDLDPLFYQTTN